MPPGVRTFEQIQADVRARGTAAEVEGMAPEGDAESAILADLYARFGSPELEGFEPLQAHHLGPDE